MKVICITDKNCDGHISVGVVYEVKQCTYYEDAYFVRGVSIQYGGYITASFRKNRFAPISDIDETTFVREYNLEKA